MKSKEIKAVFFDLGNVIICFDHMIAARKIAEKSHKNPDQIYDLFFSSNLTELFDTGLIAEADFFKEVGKLLNLHDINQDGFYKIWNNIFWENKGMLNLIKDIKLRFQKFFIVSNTNKAHCEYVWDNFPVVRLADKIITSYEIGVLKPDSLIYQKAIEEAGCEPEEIFYTDDRNDLITAAESMGINAHLFTSVGELRDAIFS